jgi:polyhydroxyalkanoate synthesis regulator protein
MDQPRQPALVEMYAGQRLYRPATSTYLTRGELITMAKNGEKFVVIDAHTNDDVTSLYHPIIVER